MKNFNGVHKKKNYFEGWYFKHYNDECSLSFIPGISIDRQGGTQAFLQVISDNFSFSVNYPASEFYACPDKLFIRVGNNIFTNQGVQIDMRKDGFCIKGQIRYGALTPIGRDIMGPFRFVPFMECNHSVISTKHPLSGRITINGKTLCFDRGGGYIEKDFGSSFPQNYLWTQCNNFQKTDCAVMASVATIPLLGFCFTGCIASVYFGGKEYRLATYTGAKSVSYSKNHCLLQNRNHSLEIKVLGGSAQKLFAPNRGQMSRIIHENNCCRIRCRFSENGRTLFDMTGEHAGFEYVEG